MECPDWWKAQEIDLSDAEKMQENPDGRTLPTSWKQMRLLKNMGSLGIIKLIPGMNKLSDDQLKQEKPS